ncbi:hypothetical protein LZ31DRAFT_615743, partial [Colletotrichum somersetense]
ACLQTPEGHSHSVEAVAFSPDARQLASASADETVKVWDTVTGQCQQTLKGHSGLENVLEVIQKLSQGPNRQHHMLSQQGAWVKNGSQNILWLLLE